MRTASASPARVASGTPLVVSWSVRAIAASPASRARRATTAGANSPSDAVEWQCRSTRAVGALRRGPGGLRVAKQLDQLGARELGQRGVGTAAPHGRVARVAGLALGPRAQLEHEPELVLVVDRDAPGGIHLPGLAVHDDRAPRHAPLPAPAPYPSPPAGTGTPAPRPHAPRA